MQQATSNRSRAIEKPLLQSLHLTQEKPFAAGGGDGEGRRGSADGEGDGEGGAAGGGAEGGSGGGSAALDLVLSKLSTCVSRDLADELAINFCYCNSKGNRK